MAKKAPEKHSLSKEHKAAMAVGRVEGRIVRDYLEAIRMNKGKPGRKRTPDSISRRLVAIENELAAADRTRRDDLEGRPLVTRGRLRPRGAGLQQAPWHQLRRMACGGRRAVGAEEGRDLPLTTRPHYRRRA